MSQLHVFDLWLCRHVRFNFGPANESVVTANFKKTNPQFVANLDTRDEYFDYNYLATEANGKYPDPAGAALEQGKRQPLLLNDPEFKLLHELIDSLTLRHRRTMDLDLWTSGLEEHYDRAVNCIREVSTNLSSHEAEMWTSRSRGFADQLLDNGLPIEDGVEVVRNWAAEVRRLLKAINRNDLLPRPDGAYPTPSTLALPALPQHHPGPRLPVGVKEHDVHRVREAIKRVGLSTTPRLIRKEAKIGNQTCRNILRYLESLGEYKGFGESKSQLS